MDAANQTQDPCFKGKGLKGTDNVTKKREYKEYSDNSACRSWKDDPGRRNAAPKRDIQGKRAGT